jgi:hypothetical protein
MSKLTWIALALPWALTGAVQLASAQENALARPRAEAAIRQPATDSWPRSFDVQGPESSSHGFAVTQPGPIEISVQWQGPPLIVEVTGPGRLAQAGQGQVRLAYQVTPADVQKGIFWRIAVRLQTPAPMQAVGTINVNRPSVNGAAVQTQLQADEARRRAMAAEPPPAPTPQVAAAFDGALQASFARFNQESQQRRAIAQRQYEAFGAQPPGAQIATRGIARGSDAISASRAPGEALASAVQPAPSPVEAPARTAPLAPPVAIAPSAQITGLSATGGAYQDQLWITGSGFGLATVDNVSQRQVHFVMGGQDVLAPINGYWTDTKIAVRVPKIQRVAPGPAGIYVVAPNGVRTPTVSYQYTPVLAARTWCMQAFPPGTTLDRGFDIPVGTWPSGSPSPSACASRPPTGGVEHRNFNFIAGTKGTDQFLRGISLANGWVIEDVVLGTFRAQQAGAYVSSFTRGSNQVGFDVRWWTDAFMPFAQQSNVAYTFAVVIKGPEDLPDGFVVR